MRRLRLKRIVAGLKGPATCLLVGTALMALLVALPILIPILAVDQAVTRRRKLAALAAAPCAVCGSSLSPDALDLADAGWGPAQAAQPTMRLRRVVRRLHAICPVCGARYEWDGACRQFHLLDPEQI
ncbi:MAG: hypothetical protein ACRYHQ_40325 [Janthinobacterium lividum]